MYAKKTILSVTCLMMSAGLISTSHATDATGSLKAKLGIGAACTLTSGNGSVLDFGNVADLSKLVNAETATGSGIKVKCSNGTPYKIGFDGGLNGEPAPYGYKRNMIGPSSTLILYALYQDARRQEQWPGIDHKNVVKGTGDGTEQEFPVYGTLPTGTAAPSGNYADTVTVTLRF
ncbi:spore coat U domain-containing protein [Pseudochrobactrum sp. MP213Fo]|uniref:Csu type fimbrial protein n=1 Tax=Pseudochrobactrum sp. MP213Fo TaxID=3022250 RepID=UPI003BA3BD4F